VKTVNRVAALGGTLYPPLALGGLLLAAPELPMDFSAAPEEIAAHVASHTPTTITWLGLGLESLGLFALALFAVRLAAHLGGWLASAAAALAVGGVVVKAGSVVPLLVAVESPDLDPQSLAALFRLNEMAVPVSEGLLAGFALLTGAAILVTAPGLASAAGAGRRLLGPWVGWGAIAAGSAILVDIAGGPGELSIISLLWLMVAGVALARVVTPDSSPEGVLPAHATTGQELKPTP
jgi:hypothetical protein